MIEKKIYYFWMGGELTRYAKGCMESWRRFMPDYEIIRIPEEYIDMDLEFNKRAYERKNWGWISDTARLNFLRTHSGIYLDTDMFLCKRIPDEMLDTSLLMASDDDYEFIGCGIIAKDNSKKVNEFIEDWYNLYVNYSSRKKGFKYFESICVLLTKFGYLKKYDIKPNPEIYVNKYNWKIYGRKYFENFEYSNIYLNEETVMLDLGTASPDEKNGYYRMRMKMFEKYTPQILEFVKSIGCDDIYNRDYAVDDEW